jgi:transcriptional regulator with XRE-family HTH domain
LAHDAGIDRSYVSALERGIYSPTIDMVEKLAKVLILEPTALLERPAKPRQRKT